jgi:hypothetical protein
VETPERKIKQSDEIFCWSCGEIIKKEAVICVHCGVQVRPLTPQFSPHKKMSATPFASTEFAKPKSKVTAVLLAVFFSYWTWLYTFGRDKTKFLIGVILNFLTIIMYTNLYIFRFYWLYRLLGQLWPVLLLSSFCIWIYSIIDVSVKSRGWYDNYPNG